MSIGGLFVICVVSFIALSYALPSDLSLPHDIVDSNFPATQVESVQNGRDKRHLGINKFIGISLGGGYGHGGGFFPGGGHGGGYGGGYGGHHHGHRGGHHHGHHHGHRGHHHGHGHHGGLGGIGHLFG